MWFVYVMSLLVNVCVCGTACYIYHVCVVFVVRGVC